MKVVITVLGKDRVGIIAQVSSVLAESNVNILDISQTIIQDYFTMIMLAQIMDEDLSVEQLGDRLDAVGRDLGVQVRVQHDAIFAAMHRI